MCDSPTGSLPTFTSVASDLSLRPNVLLKVQHHGDTCDVTSEQMTVVGWSDGGGWVDFGDLDGAIPIGVNSRLFFGPDGVLTTIVNSRIVRFFDPTGDVRSESLSMPAMENVDRSHLEA